MTATHAPSAILAGAARFLYPTLAAGAFVLLLLVVPGRERHPALEAAEAVHDELLDRPAPWLHWSLRRVTPPGETILLHFAGTP